jgi:peptidoglycan/xylan/chitin deacetylase (PgdA/CDA1 family)
MSAQAPLPRLCVLTFHRIVRTKKYDHDIEWQTFYSLLEELSASPLTVTANLAPADFSEGDVVLTFDDGTEDHLSVGAELAERGMQGVFFVSVDKIGTVGYLGTNDVRRLHSLGHVIGSHGLNHVPLDSLPSRELLREIGTSKRSLEAILEASVAYFAPPYGIVTPSVPQVLANSGYVASRSTQWGMYTSLHQRWAIPHVPITELTVKRGWVLSAVHRKQLPPAMLLTQYGRDLVPRALRAKVRSHMHRAYRTHDT